MSVYVMLTSLTDEGRKNTDEDPDSLLDINKEVEYLGAKILAQYALLGQYDFITILEAPSNEAVARLSTRLSGKGTMQTLSMAGMKMEDLINALKKKESPW